MPAIVTFSRNQNTIFSWIEASNRKLLAEALPLIKSASHQEAVSSMTSPERPKARYPADYGSANGGGHRSLRDASTYTINERSRGRGNNVGSVVCASAHAKVVHDGRDPIVGKFMKWQDGGTDRYATAMAVRGREANPWMRRGLIQGVQQSRYLAQIGLNPSALQ